MRYLLVNNSAYGVLTGASFGLEHESVNGWETVTLRMAFAAVGIIIEPGQSGQLYAPIPGDIAAGMYRLRQCFRLGRREGLGWGWRGGGPPVFEVSAAFRVTT